MLNKLNLSVGLVSVPVEIENALSDGTKPKGSHVCEVSALPYGSSVKALKDTAKAVISSTGCSVKHEGECVRTIGYAKPDGTYFVPKSDDLDKIAAEKDRQITLGTFVPNADVDPVYFKSTYVIKPQKGAEAAFWLIARRLQHSGRIAIGSAVLDKDEQMLFLRWSERFQCVFLSLGIFDEQIKRELIAGARASEPEIAPSRAMTRLADDLVTKTFDTPFEPERYVPKRWHGLRDLIVSNGASPDGIQKVKDTSEPTVDLMGALQASVALASKKTEPKKKTESRRTKKVA